MSNPNRFARIALVQKKLVEVRRAELGAARTEEQSAVARVDRARAEEAAAEAQLRGGGDVDVAQLELRGAAVREAAQAVRQQLDAREAARVETGRREQITFDATRTLKVVETAHGRLKTEHERVVQRAEQEFADELVARKMGVR